MNTYYRARVAELTGGASGRETPMLAQFVIGPARDSGLVRPVAV